MTREISDLDYINLKIKPEHSPTIKEFGDQRDRRSLIVCSCRVKTYPYPKDLSTGEFDYFDHIVQILDDEIHFLDYDSYVETLGERIFVGTPREESKLFAEEICWCRHDCCYNGGDPTFPWACAVCECHPVHEWEFDGFWEPW